MLFDALAPLAGTLEPDDVVLLPEHWDLRLAREKYEADVVRLATGLGCHVVGGSHHEQVGDGHRNSGIAVDRTGKVIGTYDKLRPYAEERMRIADGQRLGELLIGGRSVLVLICADFWFSDLFYRATSWPDLVLVPALSVTRKPTPEYSRELWRHLAIARAYEFGAYVGVSDWAHVPGQRLASGVGGFADPTTADPDRLFRQMDKVVEVIDLDFAALDAFRADRTARGFFWKPQRNPSGD